MKIASTWILRCAFGAMMIITTSAAPAKPPAPAAPGPARVALPPADRQAGPSLASVLAGRKSTRDFQPAPITLPQAAQLLWAAQGINGVGGRRTVPSAGGFYPIEIYLAAGRVTGLPPGLYRYRPMSHDLLLVRAGAILPELVKAAQGQPWVGQGAVAIVISGVIGRTAKKYGHPLADEFVRIEVGHAAQNVYLTAAALSLGTVEVGGIDPKEARRVLGAPETETAFVILPVGKPAS